MLTTKGTLEVTTSGWQSKPTSMISPSLTQQVNQTNSLLALASLNLAKIPMILLPIKQQSLVSLDSVQLILTVDCWQKPSMETLQHMISSK